MATTTNSSYYSQRHQEALELEVSLLQATLRRNRASHRRTLYWRRAQMAVRCLERHNLTDLYAAWQPLLEKEVAKVVARAERNQRRRGADANFWEILPKSEKDVNHAKQTASTIEEDDEERQLQQSLKERVDDLCRRTTASIEECLERIDFYAKVAVSELVRGFFLPLLTVVTGCLARIRVLLQRLQRHVAHMIQQQVLLKYCGDNKKKKKNGLLPETIRQRLSTTVERLLNDAMKSESTAMTTAMQKYFDDTFSRAELTTASLQSLRLAIHKNSSNNSSSNNGQQAVVEGKAMEQQQQQHDDGDDDSKTEESPPSNTRVKDVANDAGNDERKSQNNDESTSIAGRNDDNDNSKEARMPMDEHDLGESIMGAATATAATRVMQSANVDIILSKRSNGDNGREIVDQNAMVLEQLRDRKRDKMDKKKKKKRKEKSGDDSSSNNTSSVRQKKKKNKKGGDFFDDLFA